MDMNLGEMALRPQMMLEEMAQQQQNQQMNAVKLQQLQQQANDQQQMRGLVQDFANAPGSSVDKLNRAGDAALKAGMIDQAEKAYNTSGLLEQRAAHAAQYKAQAEERQLNADIRRIDSFATIAEMFPDSPAGWSAMKSAYLAQNPNPSKLEQTLLNLPYQRGLAAKLKDSLLSAKDRALGDWRTKSLQLREQQIENQDRHASIRDKLAVERESRLERQAANKKKTGGIGSPSSAQRQQAEEFIANQLEAEGKPNLEGSSMSSFGLEISSRARAIMRESDMDWEQALETAYQENEGRIQTESGYFGTSVGAKTSVTPRRTQGKPQTSTSPTSSHRDVSKSEYARLKPGETFWYGGKQYTKGAQ